MLFIKFYARFRYDSSLGEMSIFREKNVFIPKVGHLIFGEQKITHQKGCLSSCAHGDMRNLPEKFKLEKPVTTIGHSQSKKNTTNKNRFFYLRRILKVKLFLTKKKNDNSKFFLQTKHWEQRPAKDLQTTFNPSASHPAG